MAQRPVNPASLRTFRKWLLDTTILDADFSLGMVRDVEPWAIPNGGSYTVQDFMVDQPGKMYKRGGTSYQNVALSPTSASGPILVAVMAPEFPGDPRVLTIASNGSSGRSLYDVTTGVTPSEISLGVQPYENPPLYVNSSGARMIVCDSTNLGTAAGVVPKKLYLSGGNLTAAGMSGSPPKAGVSCVHAPFLVLGNGWISSTHYPNRIWFSPRTDMEGTWDTTNSWIDFDEPIVALASHGGALLVWTRSKLLRVLGDAPPGDDLFNMTIQPIANVGCIDARSIAKGDSGVYFANESGVWVTDGASVRNITLEGRISSYWRSLLSSYSVELGHVVACGIYMDTYLFVTITKVNVGTTQLLCYLPKLAWTTMGNAMAADMYAVSLTTPTGGQPNQIYLASPFDTDATHCRVVNATGIFSPTSSNVNDADGGAVLPVWQSRVFTNQIGLKRYGFGHVSYYMPASGSPALTITQAVGLNQPSFSSVDEGGTLSKNTAIQRARFKINRDTQGVSFKLTQSAVGSTATEIYAMEAEVGDFFVADGQ